jgi:hypothetical protein
MAPLPMRERNAATKPACVIIAPAITPLFARHVDAARVLLFWGADDTVVTFAER